MSQDLWADAPILANDEAERALLGMIMQRPSTVQTYRLTEDDFSTRQHQAMFRVLAACLPDTDEPIDLLVVVETMRRLQCEDAVGGVSGLALIPQEAYNRQDSAIKHIAGIVQEYTALRRLHRLGLELQTGVGNGQSSQTLLTNTQTSLGQISEHRERQPWVKFDAILRESVEEIDRVYTAGVPYAIPTGLSALDQRFGILEEGNLVIIAARPSMGKTSLALGMGIHAARAGHTVGVVSLEMTARQLAKRAMAMEGSHLTVSALNRATLTGLGWAEVAHVAESLTPLPLFCTDEGDMTPSALEQKVHSLHRKQSLALLIVDYLQLMDPERQRHQSTNDALANVSRKLKLLALKLKIPVIALSQLSRKCEERSDKRPLLSDLRDSGAIEQDADVVLMIYRDEVYNDDPQNPLIGKADLLIRKNRNGPIGEERVRFLPQQTKFQDF